MKRINTKLLLSFIVLLGFLSCSKNSLDEGLKELQSRSAMSKLASSITVTNPSFEEGTENNFTGWTLSGTATFSSTTAPAEVYDGLRAIKVINPTSNGSSGFSKVGVMTDSIATQKGTRYTVRIWARSGSSGTARIGFTALGTPTQYVPNQTISSSWQAYEWSFTANSNFTRIRLDLGADANTYFIDNITITEELPALIKNGSFEEGTGNNFSKWSTVGTATFSAATASAEVYRGSRALKVVNPTSNGTSGFSQVGVMTDSIATEIGKWYQVKIWARSASSSTARIGFTALGTPTQYVPHQTISTNWKAYEWTFSANSNFTRIRLDLGADANTYFIDSVSMVQVDTIYSRIWGANGEKWDKARIPDFTNAGYMNADQPIPNHPVSVNVVDLGAVGNGVKDNTQIFRNAIKQCAANGTVYIPAGKYLLSDTLVISRNDITIRGAGQGATTIYFTKGLEELYPKFNGSSSDWSGNGGMITFLGQNLKSGIENLSILFPDKAWAGHNWHERSYNAVNFLRASHCWVRDITVTGADIGICIRNSSNITAENWKLNYGPVRAKNSIGAGHYGIVVVGSYNLVQNFEMTGKRKHDVAMISACYYNVFRKGKGVDINFDHHSHAPRKNLFTNIDVGKGTRLYESGGTSNPPGINVEEVIWNVNSVNQMSYNHIGRNTSGPKTKNSVTIGIKTNEASTLPDADGNWYETIHPMLLYPKDLYVAQMKLVKNITVN